MNSTLLSIEEQFLDSYLKGNPVLGSSLGLEACDGHLPEETMDARERQLQHMFRHFAPLAAYIPPGKFQKAQRWIYLVTRTDDHEVMKDFNRTALFTRSIHEGYPGHHLQFVCANTHDLLPGY